MHTCQSQQRTAAINHSKALSRISTLLFGLLYSQRCRSYSPPRSRSGTAHPSSSWCREVREAAASRAWRDHPADSRTCCQERTVMSEVLPWQTCGYFFIVIHFLGFFFFADRNIDVSAWTSITRTDLLCVDTFFFTMPEMSQQQQQLFYFLPQLCSQSQLQLIAQPSLT